MEKHDKENIEEKSIEKNNGFSEWFWMIALVALFWQPISKYDIDALKEKINADENRIARIEGQIDILKTK